MLSGDNGILQRAADAKEQTVIAKEKESVVLAYNSVLAKKIGDNGSSTVTAGELQTELNNSIGVGKTTVSTNSNDTINVFFADTEHNYNVNNGAITTAKLMPTITNPPTTAVDENTEYKDTNNDTAVIPKGFRVSSDETEQTIETGLVVYDGNDNEWVWIPVPDVSVMYDTIENTALYGDTGVTTTRKSKSGIISGQARTIPGVITDPYYKEPDLIPDSLYGDTDERAQTAGFDNLVDMAQFLVNDYQDMIESVSENKGFYVGRYELTGADIDHVVEKSGVPLTNNNWYELYYACKNIKTGTTGVVEPRMMWGCQWDVMCNFVVDENHSITDSSSWGNYYYSADIYNSDRTEVIKSGNERKILNTGITTFTMAKKIYDIAGNCEESTQEAYNFYCRVARGGEYANDGISKPASNKQPTTGTSNCSSRPQLYIK